ncbi:hypothetical protein L6W60_004309 [Salmonella enterica]|nr:hypothetical protein [Salmonella enterica]EIU9581677.1 hypothetical protein [Salmonella enterica]ELC1719904.1 hypothetical protein [Salmonella enterica]
MTGSSVLQGAEQSRKIVVTGPCGDEVAGGMALLSEAGCPVCHAGEETAEAGDLVIVALSACPELGWWKEQMRLRRLRRAGHYRMVALVPGSLEKVVSRQGICPVVAGDASVPVLWRRLSAEVRAWREGRPVYEMARAGLLPVRQERALAALLSGRVVIKKVQYSHRYLGLTRLGFYSGPQYQRYHSGPGV